MELNKTTSNTTLSTESSTDTFPIVKLAAAFVVVLLAMGLNALVIYPVIRHRHMKKTINYLILNMAVSDMLMANNIWFAMPLGEFFASETAAKIGCKLIYFGIGLVFLVSPLTLLIITAARFRGVTLTMDARTSRRDRWCLLVSSWFIPAVLYSPFLYFIDAGQSRNCITISFSEYQLYVTVTFAILFPIVYVTIGVLALLISHKLRGQQVIFPEMAESQREARVQRLRNAIKMVFCTLVTFILLTTPHHVLNFIKVYQSSWIAASRLHDLEYAFTFLISLNAVISPCIYYYFIKDFRQVARNDFAVGLRLLTRKWGAYKQTRAETWPGNGASTSQQDIVSTTF